MSKTIKVRWAFNPFSNHKESKLRDLEFIKLLKTQRSAEIIPTYVLGSEHTEWVGYVAKNQGADAQNAVLKACYDKLEELGAENIVGAPEIILSDALSIRSDATTFALKCEDSDFVIVNTHSRSRVKDLLLGSFAESYLFKSKVPTIYIPPCEKSINKLDKVLYPTDLTVSSRVVFDQFLSKEFNIAKEIKLYSNVVHPVSAFVSGSSLMFGGGLISFDEYVNQDKEDRINEAREWVGIATSKGFISDFSVEEGPVPIADSIISFANGTECDAIAMSSFSSNLDSVFVGSTSREVLRKAKKPVIIWHTSRDDSKVTLD